MRTRKIVLFISFVSILSLLGFPLSSRATAAVVDTQTKISLTEEEQQFIKEHPVIRLGVDPEFVPYEFFDSDGVYKGIAADYNDLVCRISGLKMEVASDLTWAEAYDKAVNKELDLLPCVSITKQRQEYFLFSDPYISFQRAIFVNKDETSISSIDDLAGKTVAVQEHSSHEGFLEQYSEIQPKLYTNVDSALLDVSTGKAVAFIGNLATSSYIARTLGITNLNYVVIDTRRPQALYYAVRNDWPVLVGIINKALAAITEEERIAISNKWIVVQEKPDYSKIIRIAGMASIVIALIIVVSVFWILQLRKEVASRKRAQAELQLAKEDAERANQVKSMFLARMSHEIRTPLNAIMGMAYLFRKTDMTVTQSIYLDKLLQASKNMLGIINDILDFSKIEAGKIEIERVSFDLDKLLQHVISIESVRIEEQKIEFLLDKEPRMAQFFFGDPARIEQILLNIISNAIKFTKEGSVQLSVRIAEKKDSVETIEFRVKDSGIGMSREQLDRLFIPFDQGDSSISRRFGGTGLGVSIVKNLVELMGGELSVTSVVGEGTVFSVRLPLEVDAIKEKTELQMTAVDFFRSIRALVLEKNEPSRSLLESCLCSFGISADWASSEQEILQRMYQADKGEKPSYNLIMLDYAALTESGIQFISELKNHSLLGRQAKYILTIPLSREDLFEGLETAGIDFAIIKPIIPSVLFNGILEVFRILTPAKQKAEEKRDRVVSEGSYHILLVEDNKTNQYIAQSILEQAGFRVSKADDGNDGYRFFRDHHQDLDLILMDIHMPEMDGYTASDLIREIDPSVPIVAMTADAVTGVEEKCKSHGMAHYVSKPFEPDALIKTILDVIGENKASAHSQPPAPESAAAEAVFNAEDGLRRIGGDQVVFQMVLEEYMRENTHTLEALKEKLVQADYAGAVQIVHKVKGSSGNIGAQRLYAVSSDLQNSLSSGDQAVILSQYQEFETLYVQLIQEIHAYLKISG